MNRLMQHPLVDFIISGLRMRIECSRIIIMMLCGIQAPINNANFILVRGGLAKNIEKVKL